MIVASWSPAVITSNLAFDPKVQLCGSVLGRGTVGTTRPLVFKLKHQRCSKDLDGGESLKAYMISQIA